MSWSTDLQNVQSANLIHYWRLNEISGANGADLGSNNYQTVFRDNPSQYILGDPGPPTGDNDARAFTTSGQGYMDTTTGPLQRPDNITILCWVKTSAPSSTYWLIVSDDLTSRNYNLNRNANVISFTIWISNIAYTITGSTNIADNEWHMVAATFDGSELNLYIDGQSDASSVAASGNIDEDNAGFGICKVPGASANIYNGSISEVAMWSLALSASEILSLYPTPAVSTPVYVNNRATIFKPRVPCSRTIIDTPDMTATSGIRVNQDVWN